MLSRILVITVFRLACLALGTRMVLCGELPDIQSNITEILSTLTNFNGSRNDVTSPDRKNNIRDYIAASLKEYGLHVWTERPKIGDELRAENIVGMIKSKRTGTADDKIVIVGAHYDTANHTTGVDDNGSGVTALLQVAKNVAKAKCRVENTILFVAFDFEELTKECKIPWPIACGSKAYVKNISSYLNETGGTIGGAIILETMLNHNSSADSQIFPDGFEKLLPGAYKEVRSDSNRGNFLAVIGRNESDRKLLDLVLKYYSKDSNYRAQLLPIPIKGRPSLSPTHDYFIELYRSDHYSFWDTKASYSAVMLGDTANFRGYMRHCYHKICDDFSQVKDDDLEFLRRSINAVIKTVLDLSDADCTVHPSFGETSVSANLFLMLVSLIGIFFSYSY
ncbi:uncharacterized protein LOC114530078 [Dendronephthya gigantea]|uniref:uncharacterized protein LOC114530078 n=1 Tax=Dendronephthya gigantea TaxID=151771 RepID=UPI001069043B|nr:uncharacterized protein LOC114530078 [Dendronephthya gigantea]